ncbi:MAG: GNAT family N-acetyltransferase [Janthinobacterium lividum]
MFARARPSHVTLLHGDRAEDCARLHATGFPHPWDALDFERLIGAETAFGHAAVETRDPRRLTGFILSRRAADEAEVLTIVVDPASRKQGIASRLMRANMEVLARTGVKSWFLEVAETNMAARNLYAGLGFAEVGRRQGYYRNPGSPPATALVLRRAIG